MPHRPIRSFATALLMTSTTSLLHAQTPPAMNAEQGWSAVGRCASVSSERARHDCLDDVLRRAGLLTPQAEAADKRQQFGLGGEAARPPVASAPAVAPKPAPAAPAKQPAPAAATALASPPDTKPATVDRLEVTIATIAKGSDGKVVFTTADGAVWKQTDSDTIPRLPVAGDIVKIRKASLGSYLCELPSHHTFRCLRSK